jgi:hypothetical protein
MDIANWKQIMEEQQQQLLDILSDCQNGSDELVLLASKMTPILEELQKDVETVADNLRRESTNGTKQPDKM